MAYSKPFYQTKLFLNSILVILFATVVVYTVVKLENKVAEAKAHENDGYAQISTVKEVGSRDSLKTQSYVVNIHKDERIRTEHGTVILIPANTLQSKDSTVELLVKEAYTMEDMIRAGLTTKSGNDLLSSGGMFYIQAKDSANVKIVKPLSIGIPTDEVNSDMKLFTGQTTPLGKIDWQDPVALSNMKDEVISEGKSLFEANCKSCHTLGKESKGPDLAHIMKRRDQNLLGQFLVDSKTLINVNALMHYQNYTVSDTTSEEFYFHSDTYYTCLHNTYNNEGSNGLNYFHAFDKIDLGSLVNYISVESDRQKLSYPDDKLYICVKKCKEYKSVMDKLYAQKYELKNKRITKIVDNGPFVKDVNRSMQILGLPSSASAISNEERKSLIHAQYQQAEYYAVEINTFGWYNIDMLTKNIPDVVDSKLFVQVADSFANTFQIYLVLPDAKIYGAGGLLKDKKDVYGFYEDNGNIKLPQGKTAHVYLVGEKNGQLLYAAATFVTGTLNNISLNPVLISKKEFNKKIKELLNTEGMSVKASDSKNATKIRKIDSDLNALDEKIKEAEKSKPKDCDCNCGVIGEEEVSLK